MKFFSIFAFHFIAAHWVTYLTTTMGREWSVNIFHVNFTLYVGFAASNIVLEFLTCGVAVGPFSIIDYLRRFFMFQFFLSFQSPPKGATIPYRPKPQVNGPVILANGQAYTIQGNFAVPTEQVKCAIFS
jgi:hypothetical protein